MDNRWGHCMHCRHFDTPAQVPLANEEARCDHPALGAYKLRVFGTCGCIGFELRPGISPRAERPDGEPMIEAP
jgi:hypothetical protein